MESNVEQHGFEIVPGVLGAADREDLIEVLGPVRGAGRRGLLAIPEIAKLAGSRRLLDLVRAHLPAEPFAARAIYFDKSPEANWLVPWHQDLTIATRERIELPGFGPWSEKNGIPHVQPPVECLEQMVTLRLHLDAADESNGALRVLPGTHRIGRLSSGQIESLRATQPEHLCAVSAGDALLMRPLLLHASSRSVRPGHRRILHLEYAAFEIPGDLRWHETA